MGKCSGKVHHFLKTADAFLDVQEGSVSVDGCGCQGDPNKASKGYGILRDAGNTLVP